MEEVKINIADKIYFSNEKRPYNEVAASYAVKACGDTKYHDASQVGVHEAGIKHQTQNSNV